MTELSDALAAKRDRLTQLLSTYGSCAVAYSGGVDSAVVAKAAQLALGDRAIAVTGMSASLADGELEQAQQLAGLIGVRHEVIHTGELSNPDYAANAPDRCYHCKTELYDRLRTLADQHGAAVLVNGANADDLDDYRPGMQAGRERDVQSPLAECGITKDEVRGLAAAWGLPVATKPATPCLSSRVAYGQQVTPERLEMIDRAEQVLRSLGMPELRVRYHEGDLARIEVPLERLAELCELETRTLVVEQFLKLGFKFVTLDLAGFRSGSFSTLITPESLHRLS